MTRAATAWRMMLTVVLVAALHLWGLDWLRSQLPQLAPLAQMKDPLFTRLVAPEPPPESSTSPAAQLAAIPSKRQAKARREVLIAVQTERPEPRPSALQNLPGQLDAAEAATAPVDGPADPVAAAPEAPASDAPSSVAASPLNPVSQASPLPEELVPAVSAGRLQPADTWPPDTRLSYKLSGFYRGELHGSARVQWQRETAQSPSIPAGRQRYQVRFDLGATGINLMTMTSQGEVTTDGLIPRVYEEKLPNGLRRATFDNGFVKFQDGSQAELPTRFQDTASQFVELSHRFSTGQATLKAGGVIQMWLARPGGLDLWIYDIVEEEALQTERLGVIPAFRLRPRPLANPRGPIYPELWFAPSLQFLPVRVRIALGGANFVDLLVAQIEQTGVADAPASRPWPSLQ